MPEPELNIELLGAPRITRGGTAIEVDTRKATALLAYVAVTGQQHRRDALAALLWPEHDADHARAALRRTLSTLRTALGGDHLVVSRATVGLAGPSVRLDVDDFKRLSRGCDDHRPEPAHDCETCRAALSDASIAYRGDFMAGFALRDSPEFDDWQIFQAEELRRSHGSALETLIRAHKSRGDFDRAIECARRRLSADVLHEGAHCDLIELYALSGRRSAALRQYRECVRTLDQELGVAPLPATTQLYDAVKEGRLSGPRQPPAPEPQGGRRASGPRGRQDGARPLVGREQELATLRSLYDSIQTDGHFVVVEGEAGIGKSRLVNELAGELQQRGAALAAARCHRGETDVAFGTTLQLLQAALSQPGARERIRDRAPSGAAEAARLTPELLEILPGRPEAAPATDPGARARLLEGVAQVLVAGLSGPVPGAVVVDDLQWIDDASLDVLAWLVTRLRGRPLCVVGTWRPEEVPAGNRRRALVSDARRSGTGTVMELGRLSQAEVAELVRAALPDTASSQELNTHLY